MLMSVIVDGGLYREEYFMLRGLFPDALVAQRDRFVLTVGGIMVGIACLSMACGLLSARCSAIASQGFAKNLRTMLLDKIQSFSFSNIDHFSTPSLITRATTDVNTVRTTMHQIIRSLTRSPIMLVLATVMAFTISPHLALFFVGALPVLAITLAIMMRIGQPRFRRMLVMLTDLARNKMGFDGYINSDSGITTVQIYGVEDLTVPQRYAKAISAGTDVIGGNTDPENIVKAVEDGLLPKADLDRASYNRLLSLFRTKRVDNPYLDPDQADQARQDNFDGARKKAYEANQKAVVLVKNHGGVLPLAKEKKVCIVTFKGVDSGFAKMAQAMGAGLGSANADEALRKTLAEAFEKKGYTVVATPEEADVLYLHVWPISNGVVFYQFAMPVIEMGEIVTDERETNKSQKKTGKQVTVTTLKNVEKIRELADAIHARGGKVVGTCVVNNPWLLDKLEPYCDALTIQYTVSTVALNNALNAQVDVISGDFAPTGKLSLTMVSDPAVIAITEQEIDGVVREICASPNDVPGYDKDPYIDPAILAGVRGGSYAYCDADGNYYRSGFGLNY